MTNPDLPSSPACPVMRLHAALAALALIGVMLAGVWQMFGAARQIDLQKLPLSLPDFREGRSTGALEKQLDLNLPARATLIAAANTLRYLLLRSGGDQVRIGKDDWLFLTDELRYHAGVQAHLDARADLLGAASKALERDGVKLLVALVPDKARLYADRLAEGGLTDQHRTRYHRALKAIQARGVHAVDLLPPLQRAAAGAEVYYRSDTHWNQAGAQAAAGAIATAVRDLHADLRPAMFVTEAAGVAQERPGDLIRLMGLASVPEALRPRSDREIPLQTRQTSADSGGLFGDASVAVVLTGTSYSLRGNFHGFLQQALQTRVLNAAQDGSGFLQATTQYLKDEAYRSSKPQMLIWEIPERFLDAPPEAEAGWLKSVGLQP